MPSKTKLLKIRQAAEMLGVNPETLRRWDRDGTFKSVRVGKRGHRMYDEAEIAKLIDKQKK
jgi:excisionase family DNA binding protein